MSLFIEIDEYELRGDSIWVLDCSGDEHDISAYEFAKWCPVDSRNQIETVRYVKNPNHRLHRAGYEPEYNEKFDMIDFTEFLTDSDYTASAKERLQQFINQ